MTFLNVSVPFLQHEIILNILSLILTVFPDGAPFLKHWYAINIKLSNYGHQFLIALSDYRISTQLGITLYV